PREHHPLRRYAALELGAGGCEADRGTGNRVARGVERTSPELERVLGGHHRPGRSHLDPGHRRGRQRCLLLGYLSLLNQRGEKQWSEHAGTFLLEGSMEYTGEGRGERGEGRRERGKGRRERGDVIPTERHRREWRDLLFDEKQIPRLRGPAGRSLGMTSPLSLLPSPRSLLPLPSPLSRIFHRSLQQQHSGMFAPL